MVSCFSFFFFHPSSGSLIRSLFLQRPLRVVKLVVPPVPPQSSVRIVFYVTLRRTPWCPNRSFPFCDKGGLAFVFEWWCISFFFTCSPLCSRNPYLSRVFKSVMSKGCLCGLPPLAYAFFVNLFLLNFLRRPLGAFLLLCQGPTFHFRRDWESIPLAFLRAPFFC